MGGAGEKGSRLTGVYCDTQLRPGPTIVEPDDPTDRPISGPDPGLPRAGGDPSPRRRLRRAAAVALSAGLVAGAAPVDSAEHVVVAGETLSGIASGYGLGLRELAQHNDIGDVDHIVVGQILVLPEDAARGATTHRIADGDTLGDIAAAYGVTVGALVAANSIANPNLIVVGTSLAIPGPGRAPGGGDGGGGEHSVRAGETLALIAARYGVTIEALAEANEIADPDLIVIGTVLTVGAGQRSEPTEPEPSARTHTVAPGDTLAAIAAAHGVTVEALAEANGITDFDVVTVGAVLTVPAAEATPGPGPEAPPEPDAPDERRRGGTNVARRLDFWANEYQVPSDLLKALTWFESGWNNRLVSEAGAIGIGQLMPTTVEFVSRYLIGEPIDPTVPDQNIRASARFLRYLLDQTDHRPSLAVAAYYQGLTSLRRDGVFESSRFYVDGILALRSSF